MVARDHREKTYAAAVREAKAVQMRDANVRALLLYPHVGSHFAAHLLVDGARVPYLSEFVRQGAPEYEEFSVVG